MGERREGERALFYRDGSSDKVYVAWLEDATGDRFHVDFAYGRRGSTLKTGRKTSAPLAKADAQATLDKLLASKMAKGYTPEEGGAAYQGTDLAGRASGVPVQLLNAAEESEVDGLIESDFHLAQEKHDGERRLVELQGGRAQGINRKGLYIGLAVAVQEAVEGLPVSSCILDGESVGERLHAFDLLALDGEDLRNRPYRERLARLTALVGGGSSALEVVATAYCAQTKRALFENVKARGGEGVVFKEAEAAHQSGRPNSGGVALKAKFVESCSALVIGQHPSKRSISLALLDDQGQEVPVGNVTVPPNQDIPAVGSVVEVRYLYAYRSGSLFQPVLLGSRNDMAREDCVLGQLKYKAEPVAA